MTAIQRFAIHGTIMNPHSSGPYVRHEDHLAAMQGRCLAQIEEPAGAAPAAVAPLGVVAWMHPVTLDVIHADRKQEWATRYGPGGQSKAEGYSVAMVRADQSAAGAAPALEAPAAPVRKPLTRDEVAAWAAETLEEVDYPVLCKTAPCAFELLNLLEAFARDHGITAAAPQAPAAPVGLPWRTGIPPWTDDRSVRVIAVTAHDDFGGVQVHDIRASDFHTDGDGDGAEVARVCTHWAYRDDIWPRADAVAPAAPIPWDNFPAYLIDHCEGQTITEEGMQHALSAMLANPQYAGTAPAAPVVIDEGHLSDELRELIAGMTVSVDVSTGEHDAGNRLFGEVSEVMDYDQGSDKHGVVLLVQSPEPNFKATPAAPSADERAAYVEFLTGKFPRSYGKEEAGRWWDQGHVSALTWQAARAVAAAPAAPAVDAGTLRDAEHYRFIKRHRLILSGGTETFGWPIAPFGDECDRYIAQQLAAERAAQAAAKGA